MRRVVAATYDPRASQDEFHEALVALDKRGFRSYREHRTSPEACARLEETFEGTDSLDAATGGLWWLERRGEIAGYAAFDVRGYPVGEDAAAALAPRLSPRFEGERGLRETLFRAALFSIAERGYPEALFPALSDADVSLLSTITTVRESAPLMPPPVARALVLASGNGTNAQAVFDASAAGSLPLAVAGVISNRAHAVVLDRARGAGLDALGLTREGESRERYDARLLEAARRFEPEVVLLLGWMHVLAPAFVAAFPEMLNLHPAYLPLRPEDDEVVLPDGSRQPAYRGAQAVDDALGAGAGWIGASVHRVAAEVDRGPLLARAPLRLREGESREALDARLHALERRVVAAAVHRWAERRRA